MSSRGLLSITPPQGPTPRWSWRVPDRESLAKRAWRRSAYVAILVACLMGSARAAGDYPLVLTLDADANVAAAAVKSTVTIHVDRLMEESRRKRVTDALTYSGYANFLSALRMIPPIGTIELQSRMVSIRYAREQQEATGRRLVLVADRPLFFLGAAATGKARAGYELTIVELRVDAQGGVTGTMAGAARVKPSPDGIVLDDYAEAPVRLSGRVPKP
jgi:hypothetical protein